METFEKVDLRVVRKIADNNELLDVLEVMADNQNKVMEILTKMSEKKNEKKGFGFFQ